ncbi:MAG: tRNA (adenosine(37)-N6)-threonylcarbamoyltransferase complex transferase subunit TsaD [Desulfuromonadales bacterium]|nr:tRNA (adenosine(37)-N6)-threonylcarbamoyltransferase complex transferase subunit TsaD [Desulfuromonadales bacterium]
MLILCIESSCDETAAAVIRDGRTILSSIVATQVDIHARFGGVVPEIASRQHLAAIVPVVDAALEKAGHTLEEIQGIAVTRGPGLVGALLVGLAYAKSLAFARQIPFCGVHHIEGHLLAIQLEQPVAFPYLALAVSGGHTHLYRVDGIGAYTTLGRTIDDADGEAFDKVAKMLGLPYPGGARIDQLAKTGNPQAIDFPRPLPRKDSVDFSFSGMKTSVATHLRQVGGTVEGSDLNDLCASFQAAVVDVLTRKTLRAALDHELSRIVVCGGVACNSGLRQRFHQVAAPYHREVFFPSMALCADNAAMLGVAGNFYLQRGDHSGLDLNALASWPLDRVGKQEV